MQPNDVVLSINGASYPALDRAALERLVTGPVGAPLSLRVRSQAGERVVSLVLRDLL
jgi:hypothetical protein